MRWQMGIQCSGTAEHYKPVGQGARLQNLWRKSLVLCGRLVYITRDRGFGEGFKHGVVVDEGHGSRPAQVPLFVGLTELVNKPKNKSKSERIL